MHIPDGFIAPIVYVPAFAVAGVAATYALRRIGGALREETLPHLAALTGFCYVLMMISLPIPGGTSVHASGIALLAVMYGLWTTFLVTSLVLLLQALMFGAGGVTSLPVNALAMGLIGALAALAVWRPLHGRFPRLALWLAGWCSVNAAALVLAVVLGIQPFVASASDGSPLFFPFGLAVTLPAVMIPHLFIGIGEGMLVVAAYRFLSRFRPQEGLS